MAQSMEMYTLNHVYVLYGQNVQNVRNVQSLALAPRDSSSYISDHRLTINSSSSDVDFRHQSEPIDKIENLTTDRLNYAWK